MLTYSALGDLARRLRDRTVLSVYINGESRDPAARRRWRLDLRHSFDDIERWLRGSTHAEREAFAKCRALVLEELSSYSGTLRAPGWAGFFTTEGAHYAERMPAPTPTMAVWSTGACVTPYVRTLKEMRPVIVAVADSRKVRLFRYVERRVEALETVHAHVIVEPPSHMGGHSRAGFHTGTRGSTGTDEAQRELREGTAHMLTEMAGKIGGYAGRDAWIVIGGIPSVASAAMARLGHELAARALRVDTLDVHATRAQVAACARESASTLRDARDLDRVNEVARNADVAGRGVVGPVDTLRALELGSVQELYITLRYLENNAAEAEASVRRAVESNAIVEHVSGAAAERLDQLGGIGAGLRYPVPVMAAPVAG